MGVFSHGVKLYGQHRGWMLEHPRNFTVFASGSVVCENADKGALGSYTSLLGVLSLKHSEYILTLDSESGFYRNFSPGITCYVTVILRKGKRKQTYWMYVYTNIYKVYDETTNSWSVQGRSEQKSLCKVFFLPWRETNVLWPFLLKVCTVT